MPSIQLGDCVTPATFASVESSLCHMTSDCDPRVRSSAVDGLVALSQRPDGLSIFTYDTVKMVCKLTHIVLYAKRIFF